MIQKFFCFNVLLKCNKAVKWNELFLYPGFDFSQKWEVENYVIWTSKGLMNKVGNWEFTYLKQNNQKDVLFVLMIL